MYLFKNLGTLTSKRNLTIIGNTSIGVAVSCSWDFLICIKFLQQLQLLKILQHALRDKKIKLSYTRFLSESTWHNQNQL